MPNGTILRLGQTGEKIVARYQDALAGGQLFPRVLDGRRRARPAARLGIGERIRLDYHEAARYWLGDVFVLPEHRGCGAGKMLVHTAIDFARATGRAAALSLHARYAKPL